MRYNNKHKKASKSKKLGLGGLGIAKHRQIVVFFIWRIAYFILGIKK